MLIALAGYFIATLSSFYSNSKQAMRLAHLQNIQFPLALHSDATMNAFKTQIEKYEDAFLTGEVEQAIQGNRLSGVILEHIDQMKEIVGQDPVFSPEDALIDAVRLRYLEFSQLASEVYLQTQLIETSIALQKKVQSLGSMQSRLFTDIHNLSQHLAHTVEQGIQEERRHAQANTIFLGALFVLVLVSATLISRWFANHQLIIPLSRIQQMVTLFGQNKEIAQPASGNENDEISTLATSFWSMTEQLKQTMVSKDYVDNIIKHMSGCLMVLSPELTLLKVNDNTEKLLGLREENLLGRPITDFVCPDTRQTMTEKGLWVLLDGRDIINLEICLISSSGTKIPVLFSGSVMFDADRTVAAVICVATDITERKKGEEMRRKIEIERALARTASLAAIGELTSSIAHEMRNPLSSIKMNMQAIRQKLAAEDPSFAELAEITCQQSLRLETMLNDLLNYGKPLKLNIRRSSFTALMQETLISVAREKKDKGAVVEINNNLGEKLALPVDVELFTRAFSNLVLNAIQWSPQGGTVQVMANFSPTKDTPRQIILEVRDNGPGISNSKIKRLFQPFFTTREGGTGLGLANVRKIIEYHGGTVRAANNPGGGALFTITLPLTQPEFAAEP